ncbi:uncharacterized protein ACHE_80143A [Aspergillus chevalieri]|uniref:Uncharacterized protein n=1 Tax=Aspergillus chevalieri TaxID=182096 RepID=A0A7R7VXT2_ASPCH|nr:uncharacterized protein ACHE_80143A [Aspergillus chevalieri]BCR92243.1 hypothetical protein ACHE_80143A [Aspergillus chevalieri]
MRLARFMTSDDIADYKTLFLEAGERWKREEEQWKQAEEQRREAGLRRRAEEQTRRTTFDEEKVPSKTAPVDRISNPAGGQMSLQWEAVEHRARHSKSPMLNMGILLLEKARPPHGGRSSCAKPRYIVSCSKFRVLQFLFS